MAMPDLSRDENKAGQSVMQGDYYVTYDKDGYATSATNTKHEIFSDPTYDGIYKDRGWGSSSGGSSGGSGGSGSAGGGRVSGSSGSGVSGVDAIPRYDTTEMKNSLNQWLQQAQAQQQAKIDYQVDKSVQDLRQQEAESNEQFQTIRNQVDRDEARAKDNQALYAEARGDKGGIGAAQYDSIQNAAAQNRLSVNQQQAKVASEVARQITDLRAQGEFEKADALLSLSQTYLSQLMSLEQWSAEYNLNVDQFNAGLEQWKQEFNASLEQWDASFGLQLGELMGTYNGSPTLSGQQLAFNKQQYQDERNDLDLSRLSSAGSTLLSAGIMPSKSQLDAMGMTSDQAKSYIAALKASQTISSGSGSRGSGSSGGSSGSSSSSSSGGLSVLSSGWGTDSWYEKLGSMADSAGQSVDDYLAQHYKAIGMTQSQATSYAEKYATWAKNRNNWPNLGNNTPDYDTILQNSSSGAYGKKFNLVLGVVQNMTSRDNKSQDEVADYLLKQMNLGNINQAGVTVIMQALGI